MGSKHSMQKDTQNSRCASEDAGSKSVNCAESPVGSNEYCEFNEESVTMLCRSQLTNEQIAAKCNCSVAELEQTYGERLSKWRAAGIGHGKLLLFEAACKRSVTAIALFLKQHGGRSNTAEESLENSIAKYKAHLREMSDRELDDEIERQGTACGSHTRNKATDGTDGSEAPPN